MDTETPYAGLSPEAVLDAIDALGFRTDGTLTALNSYENRVYQVGLEEEVPIIAKFYRPNRWSNEAILEEHAADSDALYGVPGWLLTRACDAAEVYSEATLEQRAADGAALYGVPQAVPILEDLADPCLRW